MDNGRQEPGLPARGLPLAGLLVVSVEQAVAAPYATRQLADLGARVIKVERPGAGDFALGYDTTVHGQSSYFVWLNRGKESAGRGRGRRAGHGPGPGARRAHRGRPGGVRAD